MAREKKFSTQEVFKMTNSLLLVNGYEGFSFSLLAEALQVSRAALYKYYLNKEELIMDYMIYEMDRYVKELEKMDHTLMFEDQLDRLLKIIFQYKDIHQILGVAHQIQENGMESIAQKKSVLEKLHLDMYQCLSGFILKGKKEEILSDQVPNELILGFIFQSIAIPNHQQIPDEKWIALIKELICHGIIKAN